VDEQGNTSGQHGAIRSQRCRDSQGGGLAGCRGRRTGQGYPPRPAEVDVQRLTEELADLRGVTPESTRRYWRSSGTSRPRTSWFTRPRLCQPLLVDNLRQGAPDDLLMLVRRSQEPPGQPGQAAAHRSPATGKTPRHRTPADHRAVLAHLDPRRASWCSTPSEEHKVVSVQRLAEMRQFSPRWRRR